MDINAAVYFKHGLKQANKQTQGPVKHKNIKCFVAP